MAKIVGLDLGTNSIGWAVIDNEMNRIEAAGSRIIPMDAGRLGDFEKGNSISFTADRTQARGARRLHERFLLRRDRLLRVLRILDFLPEHYASQLSRYGKLPQDKEIKLAWHEDKDGKTEFLFKSSFEEMIADFHKVGINQKVPYDWTIYYLRQKALSQPISKEELAWLLMQFNQKRGYYQLRGKDDDAMNNAEGKNEEKSYLELKVIKVEDSGEPRKGGGSLFNITLENGWVLQRPFLVKPDWEGKTRSFIATFKLDKDGNRKTELPKLSAPQEGDWGLRKIKTEHDITESHHTIGSYIYQSLLHNPDKKILGELVQTVDRKFYYDELCMILDSQKKFHPELNDRELYARCIEELYPSNISYRNSIDNRDFVYLLADDILFYQRPLKTKKHLIANCPFEIIQYKDPSSGELRSKPIKCIPKSHPLYQEFRLWQFLSNLRFFKEGEDITSTLLPDGEAYAKLYDFLTTVKTIGQKDLFKYFKIGKNELPKYRWNYVQDKDYPAGETHSILLGGLKKAKIDSAFLTNETEEQLWHILYSVDDKKQYRDALHTFARHQEWNAVQTESFVQAFDKLTIYKEKDYGAYSAKAISRLIPLMRRGRYWNAEAIDKNTCRRIEHIITGESDATLTASVRERFEGIENINQCQGLNTWQACYLVYNRHSEAIDAQKWNKPEDIDQFLSQFRHNSLNNPVVEQVVTESLRVVRDIWRQVGHIDEIHIELGRELKKTKSERERLTKVISEGEATNQRIRLLLMELMNPDFSVENVRPQSPSQQELLKIYEDGVFHSGIDIPEDIQDIKKRFTAPKNQPTHNEIIRYKLWLDQKYISPYTNRPIPLAKLFTPAYQIEHIIPQSRWFDDSFSNKVICEAEVNRLKDRDLSHEFISKHAGEEVPLSLEGSVKILTIPQYEELIKRIFAGNPKKLENLMLDDIPEDFINRQMNDSRYISRLMMHLLSNIVRTEEEDGDLENSATSKNVIPCNGPITDRLKHDWGIDDVWNRIILPRFERLNHITGTTDYTTTTANGHTIPSVPIELRQGFNKKRIDHRHHAMDAIVIACATRDHVNLLNNESSENKKRYGLQRKLRQIKYDVDSSGQKRSRFAEFYKPWPTFTEDVYHTLQGIIVSFKQNLRVINRTSNHYTTIQGGKHIIAQQQKGDNWAIRKPLHKETVYGEVNLQLRKKVKIKEAIANPNSIVSRELKDKIKEKLALHFTSKQIIEYLDKHKDIWSEAADGEIEVYYYTKDTKDRYFATRYKNELQTYLTNLKNEADAISKIEKITDTGIQKILLHHLVNEGRDPQKTFSPEGIERMNANITFLNDGKRHLPIKKVRVFTKGEKFNLSNNALKSHKFYNGDDGKNLHYVIYTNSNDTKRNFLVVELQVAIECQKKYGSQWRGHLEEFLKNYQKDTEKNQPGLLPEDCTIKYILSAGDIVYMPSSEEYSNPYDIHPSNLFRVRSFDDGHFYCIPINVANIILDKKEFGSPNKTQKDDSNRMIRDHCVPIQIDRLGNIIFK